MSLTIDSDVTPVKKKSKHEDDTPDSSTRRTRLSNAKYVICLSGFKENSVFNAKLRSVFLFNVATCQCMQEIIRFLRNEWN
jgi:hypothetical protein